MYLFDFFYFLSEFFLIFSITWFLLIGVIFSTSNALGYPIVISGQLRQSMYVLFIALFLCAQSFSCEGNLYFYLFEINSYTQIIKSIILVGSIFYLCIIWQYLKIEKLNSFEHISLVLLAILGMLFLISSNNFISFYLALELQALSFYVLTAFKRNSEYSTEAGLKYFILGAFSSGLFLFGIALLYSMCGLITFQDLSLLLIDAYSIVNGSLNIIFLGLIFLISGFFFKLYSVPFHLWVPDIYQGAPTSVTSLFASIPSYAMGSILIKILFTTFYSLFNVWETMLLISGILSLVLGSFAALYQQNIKRFLAYSSISNIGFLLLALASGSVLGLQSFFLFLVIYVITQLSVFGSLLVLKKVNSSFLETIKEFSGLYLYNPILCIIITISFFSMAGVPPLAGFFSKFYVFFSLLDSGWVSLVLISIFVSTISAFYYLRFVKSMYFDFTAHWNSFLSMPLESSYVLSILSGFLILFFFYPSFIMHLSLWLSYLI